LCHRCFSFLSSIALDVELNARSLTNPMQLGNCVECEVTYARKCITTNDQLITGCSIYFKSVGGECQARLVAARQAIHVARLLVPMLLVAAERQQE
jgi:hypothetical protein